MLMFSNRRANSQCYVGSVLIIIKCCNIDNLYKFMLILILVAAAWMSVVVFFNVIKF